MNDTHALKIGQVVTSKAGRDKGRAFVIIEIVDHEYVKVTDGDLRRIERPKLKKVKHLNVSHMILTEIEMILMEGKRLSNEMLRKSLEGFTFTAE
ncbi:MULTISPECIES: KOW domain-containing RNA-binding protein [unclassified Fusibacter]|uniref:KOW domain-containing RNA-binding protein n=1 Tax=unclassified Fusibacter TaxID=2624464 RepID=UPI0010111E1D|nr:MULTISPECIES: KOW domain-containing RNA-binding protein [unclassified Fusibacter]MCK8061535.1 KOW domain-containing RNA-binding protein [Fusibacter sp. A2]NPE23737.1 RNA-binding protein [Fusibacter sp. A1]RXV58764.1 RNA-binding protein [Fusibacter sp. A1]